MWRLLLNFQQNNVMLGRWAIHYDKKIIDKKICQSQDHSLCFNQFSLSTTESRKASREEDEKYLEPYII